MSLLVDIKKRLGDFSLRVRFETDGALALLGASGSGKSLTLQCIAGILTPDEGKIVLDGKTLFDSEKRIDLPPQQRGVGYLFQNYALFPNMTVAQNVACGIRTGGRSEKRQAAKRLLRKFRLDGLENKYPQQLSGGEQQRTALARILASEPQMILLDEPLSALDSFLRWNLEQELHELLSGFSGEIIWVSHDLGECRRNCQTVCVLHEGKSSEVTDVQTLMQSPPDLYAARLIGLRNFVQASRTENGVLLDGWKALLATDIEAERCTVAVPTDALLLTERGTAATVLHVISDLPCKIAVLTAPQAQPLYAAVPNGMELEAGQSVRFTVNADRCFCYPNE